MATATSLPIYMRIGNGTEIQVGTVEMEAGEPLPAATAAISQLLHRVGEEVQRRSEGPTPRPS